jgi:hypothetical protein
MEISDKALKIRKAISDFDKRIEEMHLEFTKYHNRDIQKMPDWEGFQRTLITFSRNKIPEIELSTQLDRVLYKFQNRKNIWLKWTEEVHRGR